MGAQWVIPPRIVLFSWQQRRQQREGIKLGQPLILTSYNHPKDLRWPLPSRCHASSTETLPPSSSCVFRMLSCTSDTASAFILDRKHGPTFSSSVHIIPAVIAHTLSLSAAPQDVLHFGLSALLARLGLGVILLAFWVFATVYPRTLHGGQLLLAMVAYGLALLLSGCTSSFPRAPRLSLMFK